MANKPARVEGAKNRDSYLPNFCHAETNLLMILVLELVAIVLALASMPVHGNLFVHIAVMSVYVQWIGLMTAAILCPLSRYRLLAATPWITTTVSLLVLGLVTVLLAGLAYHINGLLRFDLFQNLSLPIVILEHLAISLILFGLALRYFYVQFQGRRMIKMESRSRLQALQARIRPHFLFNSLNTIASLTHDEPDLAERAIESLADLFRASLNADASISLQREIDLTRDYIELEQLRLDDRLQIEWRIEADTEAFELPALTLQPLVENAIYHGIEPLPDGGKVSIAIEQTDHLLIEIVNPLNERAGSSHREGNRMALANISERLQLAFQGQAKIEHAAENELYRVLITIPAGNA